MNYIAEFMKNNGLVEGQEFASQSSILKFINNMLLVKDVYENFVPVCQGSLVEILTGNKAIAHLPFKPQEDEMFYYYDYFNYNVASTHFCCRNENDLSKYKLGNCFRTERECELNIPKIKQIFDDIRKELEQ